MALGQVKRIEPLVATVQAVNDQLAQDKREKALLSIDAKIHEATSALLKASAGPELRNKVLLPLQQLKTQVAGLSSIPQILYLQGQAGDRLDEAMDAIAAAAPKQTTSQVAAPAGPLGNARGGSPSGAGSLANGDGPGTVPRPSQVVRAADLSPKTYLETEAEVDAYLASLKARLLTVLNAGQRVRIQ